MSDRTRSRSTSTVPVQISLVEKLFSGGSCTASPSYASSTTYLDSTVPLRIVEEEMTDRVIPDFHKRKSQGEVFFNPMTKLTVESEQTLLSRDEVLRRYRWSCTPKRWYEYHRHVLEGRESTLSRISSQNLGSTVPTLLEPGNLSEQAISQAWSNLDQAEVLALVALAEAEKTIDTVRTVLRRALKLILTARKRGLRMVSDALRSKKSRKQLLKDLSDLYLEARYGLRPMYYDIVGISKAVRNFDAGKNDRLTVRGFRSLSDQDSGSSSVPSNWGYATRNYCHEWNDNRFVEVRAGCLAQVKLQSINKWGLNSLPTSVWELVPFSFIVDWFFNVGDIIGSWSPQPNTNVLGSWLTVNSVATRIGTLSLTYQNGSTSSYLDEFDNGAHYSSYQITVTRKERIPHPSKPIIPSWNINLDKFKLLDLGLIANNFRKEKTEAKSLEHKFKGLRF